MLRCLIAVFVLLASLSASAVAQNNRIDVVTPLAPELASYGRARYRCSHDSGDRPESD